MYPLRTKTREQYTNSNYYIVTIEVVMSLAQRLPYAFRLLSEHWTYLQSSLYHIAMTSINTPITQEDIKLFDELKDQALLIDYCIKVTPQ
jgi:hypothetical protein